MIILISGDILPSGLHYRMNLETGKKEAKLIDLNDDSDKQTSLTYDESKQENIDSKVAESIRKIDDENISVSLKELSAELYLLF